MKEIWKDIEGYEGYQVSNLGRVRSFKNGKVKFLKSSSDKDGYLRVILRKNNSVKALLIHRLVAQAFLDNPNNLPQVNHKDENPSNNIVSNIEYCDAKYNLNYGSRNEKASISLTNRKDLSKVVIQIDKNTNVIINIFPSMMEAHRETGCNQAHICNCCKGKRKTAGGYIWKYA